MLDIIKKLVDRIIESETFDIVFAFVVMVSVFAGILIVADYINKTNELNKLKLQLQYHTISSTISPTPDR